MFATTPSQPSYIRTHHVERKQRMRRTRPVVSAAKLNQTSEYISLPYTVGVVASIELFNYIYVIHFDSFVVGAAAARGTSDQR